MFYNILHGTLLNILNIIENRVWFLLKLILRQSQKRDPKRLVLHISTHAMQLAYIHSCVSVNSIRLWNRRKMWPFLVTFYLCFLFIGILRSAATGLCHWAVNVDWFMPIQTGFVCMCTHFQWHRCIYSIYTCGFMSPSLSHSLPLTHIRHTAYILVRRSVEKRNPIRFWICYCQTMIMRYSVIGSNWTTYSHVSCIFAQRRIACSAQHLGTSSKYSLELIKK